MNSLLRHGVYVSSSWRNWRWAEHCVIHVCLL